MRLNDPNRPVLVTRGIRVLALVAVVLASFASPIGAQTVLPPQLPNFLCLNYRALRDLAPLVALIVMNLNTLLGTFGLTVSCT